MERFSSDTHEIKWIPVKKLSVVWAEAQRDLKPAKAKAIADAFDPDLFDPVNVTLPNGEGLYHVVDGQHRRTAVAMLWGENERIPCIIHDAKDPARAAKLFLEKNTGRRPPSAVERFKVAVTAGEKVQAEINDLVIGLGLRVGTHKSDGVIRAVSALTFVHDRFGCETLRESLLLIIGTWGHDSDALDAELVRGYGAFLGRYGHEITKQKLVDGVKEKLTPGQLVTQSRSLRQVHAGMRMVDAVVDVLVGIYNKGLRENKKLKR